MIYLDEHNDQSNRQKNNFIKLIVSVVTHQKVALKDLNIENIIKLSIYHHLETFIFKGLELNEIAIPNQFRELNQKLLYKTIAQDAEKENLTQIFHHHEIDYILLKGAIIRDFYPAPEMRNMADLDILVRHGDLKKIKTLMEEAGYKLKHTGGHHDCYFKKPFMNVEIHHTLVPETHEAAYNYYQNIWKKINKNQLSSEDFYIYLIVHAAKHFTLGGIGVRILTDIYYYTNKVELDYQYVYNQLNIIGYKRFALVLNELCTSLFLNNNELTVDLQTLLIFLINSGTYGTFENNSATEMAKSNNHSLSSGKRKYFIRRLFPPYALMKSQYPLLKKVPILLPWYWIIRLIVAVVSFPKYKGRIKSINAVDHKKIEEIKIIKRITDIND